MKSTPVRNARMTAQGCRCRHFKSSTFIQCRLTTRSTGPLAGGAHAPSARGRLAWFVRQRPYYDRKTLVGHSRADVVRLHKPPRRGDRSVDTAQ